jgi:hypothetical protein
MFLAFWLLATNRAGSPSLLFWIFTGILWPVIRSQAENISLTL